MQLNYILPYKSVKSDPKFSSSHVLAMTAVSRLKQTSATNEQMKCDRRKAPHFKFSNFRYFFCFCLQRSYLAQTYQ